MRMRIEYELALGYQHKLILKRLSYRLPLNKTGNNLCFNLNLVACYKIGDTVKMIT